MKEGMDNLLPSSQSLRALLDLQHSKLDSAIFGDVLLTPLASALHRPAKKFRSKLVMIGYEFGCLLEKKENRTFENFSSPHRFSQLVEQMHMGSLIIDDIQDDSHMRRGSPSLHRVHGVPLAINAGNWLYFWQLQQIRSLNLEPRFELEMYRLCLETYLCAHFGQAVDLGCKIDEVEPEEIKEICMASMELKTGALFSFAMGGGAILAESSVSKISALVRFAKSFGIFLQMLDDIGNIRNEKLGHKQFEDLRLRRPTWVWVIASTHFSREGFDRFCALVRSDDLQLAAAHLREHGLLTLAKKEALFFYEKNKSIFLESLSFDAEELLKDLELLEHSLVGAYE